jgi:glycosyltransferase involved in cell wall biosynthesis
MHIAMIGTRGVPARYGGFETCVEEVGRRLVQRGHSVTVYCRRADGHDDPEDFLGMRRVELPAVRRRSLETLSHTAASVMHAVTRAVPDVALVFNAANAPLLPLLRARGIPVATHVDGLEWQREKWGKWGKRYYRLAEAAAVRWSDAIVADAPGIAKYYEREFNVEAVEISYGAPLVTARPDVVELAGFKPGRYHLVVSRMEPENNVAEVVKGFVSSAARLPLLVVGSAPYADSYAERVRRAADSRVTLLGAVWDQVLLDQLYANALVYWHGHSVGGTNPSLLRAIGASAAVNAFDVEFNRDVLHDSGRYWTTADDVARLAEDAEAHPDALAPRREAALRRASTYQWDDVTARYEDLCTRLLEGSLLRPPGVSGRRSASTELAGRAT